MRFGAAKFFILILAWGLIIPTPTLRAEQTSPKKPIEEMDSDELKKEIDAVNAALEGLELNALSKWYLDNGDGFTNGGFMTIIANILVYFNKAKERHDIQGLINKKEGQKADLEQKLKDHEPQRNLVIKLIGALKDSVVDIDRHVETLPELIAREFPRDEALYQEALAALKEWRGQVTSKYSLKYYTGGKVVRSRERLDRFLNEIENRISASSHPQLQQWYQGFVNRDYELSLAAAIYYEQETKLINAVRELYPELGIRRLRPITEDSKITPGRLLVDLKDSTRPTTSVYALARFRKVQQSIDLDEAARRPENTCLYPLVALSKDISHLGRVGSVVYGVYGLGGVLLAAGTYAKSQKHERNVIVDEYKSRKQALEEARDKIKKKQEEVARSLESQIAQALTKDPKTNKDSKSLHDLATITMEVLRERKADIRKAIEEAYADDPKLKKILEVLDEELKKFDDPKFLERVLKKFPTALASAYKDKGLSGNVTDLIIALGNQDKDYRDTTLFDLIMLYYGNTLHEHLSNIRPRVARDQHLSARLDGDTLKPLGKDTLRKMLGLPLQPQDPGSAAPTPANPTGNGTKTPDPTDTKGDKDKKRTSLNDAKKDSKIAITNTVGLAETTSPISVPQQQK